LGASAAYPKVGIMPQQYHLLNDFNQCKMILIKHGLILIKPGGDNADQYYI
jgi:hypothetical protein